MTIVSVFFDVPIFFLFLSFEVNIFDVLSFEVPVFSFGLIDQVSISSTFYALILFLASSIDNLAFF